jgi:hypothetical protein
MHEGENIDDNDNDNNNNNNNNNNNRIAAILYSLGTWFVSGIYVQIPCMKEITLMMMMMMIIIMVHRSSCKILKEHELYWQIFDTKTSIFTKNPSSGS